MPASFGYPSGLIVLRVRFSFMYILLFSQDKRVQKKNVKVAFTSEAKVVANALANPEAPQNRSVFSYS